MAIRRPVLLHHLQRARCDTRNLLVERKYLCAYDEVMSIPNNDSVHEYHEPVDEREVDVRSLSYVEEKTCQAQKLFLKGFRAGGTIKAGRLAHPLARPSLC